MNQLIKLVVVLLASVGICQGLQCYSCTWEDVGTPDLDCKNSPLNSTLVEGGSETGTYCLQVTGLHGDGGPLYGQRLAYNITDGTKFEDGQCADGIPHGWGGTKHIDMLKHPKTCYYTTDASNNKPFAFSPETSPTTTPSAANSNLINSFLLSILISIKIFY